MRESVKSMIRASNPPVGTCTRRPPTPARCVPQAAAKPREASCFLNRNRHVNRDVNRQAIDLCCRPEFVELSDDQLGDGTAGGPTSALRLLVLVEQT